MAGTVSSGVRVVGLSLHGGGLRIEVGVLLGATVAAGVTALVVAVN